MTDHSPTAPSSTTTLIVGFNAFITIRTHGDQGYAFCEWADPSVTDKAVEGLHGLPLGADKKLTVRHAMPSAQAKQAMRSQGSVNNALGVASATGAAGSNGAAANAGTISAGKVLVLGNMITAEDFADPEELADIKLDVKEECANYGTVNQVVLAPPGVLPGELWNGA